MKKLFMTAIALIAFNGVSMGNTIEVEKLVDDPQTDFCSLVAADVMTEIDPNCDLPDKTYNQMYQNALILCIGNTIMVIH